MWLRDGGGWFCCTKGSMPCAIICPLSPADLRGSSLFGLWDVLGVMEVLRDIAFSDSWLTLLPAVTSWARKDVEWVCSQLRCRPLCHSPEVICSLLCSALPAPFAPDSEDKISTPLNFASVQVQPFLWEEILSGSQMLGERSNACEQKT